MKTREPKGGSVRTAWREYCEARTAYHKAMRKYLTKMQELQREVDAKLKAYEKLRDQAL